MVSSFHSRALLLEPTSLSPALDAAVGLGLSATRDGSGRAWLHGLARSEPSASTPLEHARAFMALGLHLCWEVAPAPRSCLILPSRTLAAEAVAARRSAPDGAFTLAFSLPFEAAFGHAAPHRPCFVTLVCGPRALAPLRLDPARLAAEPACESLLGDTPGDRALHASITSPGGG